MESYCVSHEINAKCPQKTLVLWMVHGSSILSRFYLESSEYQKHFRSAPEGQTVALWGARWNFSLRAYDYYSEYKNMDCLLLG